MWELTRKIVHVPKSEPPGTRPRARGVADVVYLVVYELRGDSRERATAIRDALRLMDAVPVVGESAWLLDFPRSAPELYLDLAKHLDLPAFATLFVAEATTNSIGSYFTPGHTDPVSRGSASAIAALVGRARRS